MLIIRVKGGLGNQLFQYATGYAVAKRMNTDLRIDKSFYSTQKLRGFKLSLLNINKIEIKEEITRPLFIRIFENKYVNKLLRIMKFKKIKIAKQTYFLDSNLKFMPEIFKLQGNRIYLDGYFQSYEYFESYRNELINLFTPQYCYNDEWQSYYEEINRVESVAIHVRRGDYLKIQNKNGLQYVLEERYYKQAIDLFQKKLDNPVFYWFSDDIEWVKEHFSGSLRFKFIRLTGENADLNELMLMSKCKNIITANSSFSWWAAWLNTNENAIIVAPKRKFGNEDMIPKNWIKI